MATEQESAARSDDSAASDGGGAGAGAAGDGADAAGDGKQADGAGGGAGRDGSGGERAKVPLEDVVLAALKKLTAQIFLFLVAFVALLIILIWLVPAVLQSSWVLPGLFVLAIFGMWLYARQRGAKIASHDTGSVIVRSLIAKDGAVLIGVEGDGHAGGKVELKSWFAKNAKLVGVSQGGKAQATDEAYLLREFAKLDEPGRQEAIDRVRELVRGAGHGHKK